MESLKLITQKLRKKGSEGGVPLIHSAEQTKIEVIYMGNIQKIYDYSALPNKPAEGG